MRHTLTSACLSPNTKRTPSSHPAVANSRNSIFFSEETLAYNTLLPHVRCSTDFRFSLSLSLSLSLFAKQTKTNPSSQPDIPTTSIVKLRVFDTRFRKTRSAIHSPPPLMLLPPPFQRGSASAGSLGCSQTSSRSVLELSFLFTTTCKRILDVSTLCAKTPPPTRQKAPPPARHFNQSSTPCCGPARAGG